MQESENGPNILEIRQANARALDVSLQSLFRKLKNLPGPWFDATQKLERTVSQEVSLSDKNCHQLDAEVVLSYKTINADFQMYTLFVKLFDKSSRSQFGYMSATIEIHDTELSAAVSTKVIEGYQGLGIPTALLAFGEAPLIEFLRYIAKQNKDQVNSLSLVFEDDSVDGWTTRKANFLEGYEYNPDSRQFKKTIVL